MSSQSQSQTQSQLEESNKLVLQNRDLMQLMGLANLDQKLPKSTVLKINITDALGNQNLNFFIVIFLKRLFKSISIRLKLDFTET